jgi:hypothetical protein
MSLNISTSSFGTLIWQTFQLYVQDENYGTEQGIGKISLNDECFFADDKIKSVLSVCVLFFLFFISLVFRKIKYRVYG